MAKGWSSSSLWLCFGGTVGTLTGANAVAAVGVGIGERESDGRRERRGGGGREENGEMEN